MDINIILRDILEVFNTEYFCDSILEIEKMRVVNEINDFQFKSDLKIEEEIDSSIWDFGLSKSIRGKNTYIYTIQDIKDVMLILRKVNLLIIYIGGGDKEIFFNKIKDFIEDFSINMESNPVSLFDYKNTFIPLKKINNFQPNNKKSYISYGITSTYFTSDKDIYSWIFMSTLISGHQNALLPLKLSFEEKKVYSIYSIATKYRYENMIKIKCICDDINIKSVLETIQKCVYSLPQNITQESIEYSKLTINSYIDETLMNPLRLIELITKIFLRLLSSDDIFEDNLTKSINNSRFFKRDDINNFIDNFLKNSNEYIFVSYLNGGKDDRN